MLSSSQYGTVWPHSGMALVLLQLKDPLELFVKEERFFPVPE